MFVMLVIGVGFWADVSGVTVLLAVLALAVVAVMARVLGPWGRPAPARQRRSGGLSRALAARADREGVT